MLEHTAQVRVSGHSSAMSHFIWLCFRHVHVCAHVSMSVASMQQFLLSL